MSGAVALLLAVLGVVVGSKPAMSSEKLSPFECGFNPKVNHRSVFSVQFFLVALIFIVFDVELVLLYPVILRCFNAASE